MPECWFSMLPDAGPCEGRLVRCHLIPRQKLEKGPHVRNGQRLPIAETDREAMDIYVDGGPMVVVLSSVRRDTRSWVWGCGGPMGPGGHHGLFKPDGPRPIERHRLPPGLEEFAEEIGLSWWLDYTYGPREAEDVSLSWRWRRATADDYAEPVRGMILRGEIEPPDEFVIPDRDV
jgi:hypothetical protein